MYKVLALVLFLFLPLSVNASADNHFKFWQGQAPMICGTVEQITEFSVDKGYIPFAMSYGRIGGESDGDVAFVVTHWLNEKDPESQMVTMSNPEATESCILFTSFDTFFNPNFNNGTDL